MIFNPLREVIKVIIYHDTHGVGSAGVVTMRRLRTLIEVAITSTILFSDFMMYWRSPIASSTRPMTMSTSFWSARMSAWSLVCGDGAPFHIVIDVHDFAQ